MNDSSRNTTNAPTVAMAGTTFCIGMTRPIVSGSKRSEAAGMSPTFSSPMCGEEPPLASPTVAAPSAVRALTETLGGSPTTASRAVAVRVARPQPRPTMLIVAMMMKLAGMPMAASAVVAVASLMIAVSTAMAVRPRRMLKFRSPGRIEPGGIPRWQVAVWRGSA